MHGIIYLLRELQKHRCGYCEKVSIKIMDKYYCNMNLHWLNARALSSFDYSNNTYDIVDMMLESRKLKASRKQVVIWRSLLYFVNITCYITYFYIAIYKIILRFIRNFFSNNYGKIENFFLIKFTNILTAKFD